MLLKGCLKLILLKSKGLMRVHSSPAPPARIHHPHKHRIFNFARIIVEIQMRVRVPDAGEGRTMNYPFRRK